MDLKRLITNALNSPELSGNKEEIKKLANELECEELDIAAALLDQVKKDNLNKTKIYFKKNPNSQRFFINVGKVDELDERKLINFIIELIPSITIDDFSDVYLKEKYSFIELPKERTEEVLKAINGSRLKNRTVRIETSEKKK